MEKRCRCGLNQIGGSLVTIVLLSGVLYIILYRWYALPSALYPLPPEEHRVPGLQRSPSYLNSVNSSKPRLLFQNFSEGNWSTTQTPGNFRERQTGKETKRNPNAGTNHKFAPRSPQDLEKTTVKYGSIIINRTLFVSTAMSNSSWATNHPKWSGSNSTQRVQILTPPKQPDFSNFVLDRDPKKKPEFPVTLSSRTFLISNELWCSDTKDTLLLIMVHSAIRHSDRRQAIRNTWANKYIFKNITLKLIFLIGTEKTAKESQGIRTESQIYGDLVQGDFVDTYRNLSHKGVMGFLWVATYCPMADLLIKVDDDVYLNMYKVVQGVLPWLRHRKRHILCEANWGFPIHREPGVAWSVDKRDFPHFDRYPPFCRGPTVFLTPDLMLPLLEAARKAPIFWIDDVYLFGMLPLVAKDVTFSNFAPNCTMFTKKCLEEYESKDPTNLAACKATSGDIMHRLWRHGWRRIPENSKHILSVNFLPVVENFMRNFPKLDNYKFKD